MSHRARAWCFEEIPVERRETRMKGQRGAAAHDKRALDSVSQGNVIRGLRKTSSLV